MLSTICVPPDRSAYFLPLTYYSETEFRLQRRVQRTALIYSLLTAIFDGGVSTVLCSTYCRPPFMVVFVADFLVLRPESQTYLSLYHQHPLNFYYLATTINECSIRTPSSTREAPPLTVVPLLIPPL